MITYTINFLDLHRYYVVDFKLETFAVSILQHELIDRKKTQWGTYRLAVEGEVYIHQILLCYKSWLPGGFNTI